MKLNMKLNMKKGIIAILSLFMGTLCFAQGPARDVPQKAVQPGDLSSTTEYRDYSNYEKGFWAGVDLGTGVAFTGIGVGMPLDFAVQLGYRFNQYIKLGAGGGFRYNFFSDKLRDNSGDAVTMKNWSFPIYLDLRGNFFSQEYREAVPFWRFDVGYTINDGFMFSPGFGYAIGAGPRNHFTVGISYVGQCASVITDRSTLTHDRGYINQFQIKLGYEF